VAEVFVVSGETLAGQSRGSRDQQTTRSHEVQSDPQAESARGATAVLTCACVRGVKQKVNLKRQLQAYEGWGILRSRLLTETICFYFLRALVYASRKTIFCVVCKASD